MRFLKYLFPLAVLCGCTTRGAVPDSNQVYNMIISFGQNPTNGVTATQATNVALNVVLSNSTANPITTRPTNSFIASNSGRGTNTTFRGLCQILGTNFYNFGYALYQWGPNFYAWDNDVGLVEPINFISPHQGTNSFAMLDNQNNWWRLTNDASLKYSISYGSPAARLRFFADQAVIAYEGSLWAKNGYFTNNVITEGYVSAALFTNSGGTFLSPLTASKMTKLDANKALTNSSIDSATLEGIVASGPVTNGTLLTASNAIVGQITGGSATNAIGNNGGVGTNTTLYGTTTLSNIIGTNLTLSGTLSAPSMSLASVNTADLVVTNGITNSVGFFGSGASAMVSAPFVSSTVKLTANLIDGTDSSIIFTNNQGQIVVITNDASKTTYFKGTLNLASNVSATTATFSGAVLSTSTSSNAPSENELVQAQWVRGLFAGAGVSYYSSSNITSFTNTAYTNITVYSFQTNTPIFFARSYANPIAGQYIGGVATTNRLQYIGANITVNAYLSLSTGGSDAASVKPEIYVSYDGTNWLGDWDAQAQALVKGQTNLFQWVIQNPSYVSTNATGFYVGRFFKVTAVAGTPTVTFTGGTNFPSHITLPGQNNAAGNAFLNANQTFTGLNSFTSTVNADTVNATNLTLLRTTNNLAGAASNIVVNMSPTAAPCLVVTVTNNITLTNFTGFSDAVSFVKTIIFEVTQGGPWTITYPTGGAPSYGVFWKTNAPPMTEPYTSLTNGSTYVLTVCSWKTNMTRSMYECK